MLEKKTRLWTPKNDQEAAKSAQKDPRSSQTSPKWGPRPSQNRLLRDMWTFFFRDPNLHRFFIFFSMFLVDVFKIEPLILVFFPRENAIFYKIGIFKKNPKNLWMVLPKSSQNPSKILPKSMKNRTKSMKKPRLYTKSQKCEQKFPKKRLSSK